MKFEPDIYYREQCQFSNELMLEALHLQFAIFANRHKVSFTDAMVMLQNSFEPVKQ